MKSHATAALPALFCLVLGQSAQAATIDFTRHMDVYFGTWEVLAPANPTPIGSQTFVELTDHISEGLASAYELDALVDARVISEVPLWVTPLQTNIEWVTGSPENLPAMANFNAAIAALGGSITTDSGFLSGGTRRYLLTSFVQSGDTYNFSADVSFFERNGSVTLNAVPEPSSAALLGVALLGLFAALGARKTNGPFG